MNEPAASSTRRRFDPFRVLDEEERRVHMERYHAFLMERDGELDLEARRLSARESFFSDLDEKVVEWDGPIDYEGFSQHYLAAGSGPIDARTVWLVAIAKSNESESYGVELELARFFRRRKADDDIDPAYLHMIVQEHYHSRILLEACKACGLAIQFRKPHWPQRWIIHTIMKVPESVRWVLILCGEVLGSVVFRMLREQCDLFSAQPEVEARLRMLLGQIELDEVLHVAYLRARVGPFGIRVARMLAPLVAAWTLFDIPQFASLGCDRRELMRRLRAGLELPPEIDWIPADPIPR